MRKIKQKKQDWHAGMSGIVAAVMSLHRLSKRRKFKKEPIRDPGNKKNTSVKTTTSFSKWLEEWTIMKSQQECQTEILPENSIKGEKCKL